MTGNTYYTRVPYGTSPGNHTNAIANIPQDEPFTSLGTKNQKKKKSSTITKAPWMGHALFLALFLPPLGCFILSCAAADAGDVQYSIVWTGLGLNRAFQSINQSQPSNLRLGYRFGGCRLPAEVCLVSAFFVFLEGFAFSSAGSDWSRYHGRGFMGE